MTTTRNPVYCGRCRGAPVKLGNTRLLGVFSARMPFPKKLRVPCLT